MLTNVCKETRAVLALIALTLSAVSNVCVLLAKLVIHYMHVNHQDQVVESLNLTLVLVVQHLVVVTMEPFVIEEFAYVPILANKIRNVN